MKDGSGCVQCGGPLPPAAFCPISANFDVDGPHCDACACAFYGVELYREEDLTMTRKAPSRTRGKPTAVDAHVGRRIRERRQLLGMSQTILADAVDLTFQQIQKYENGTNRVGASRLWSFASALNVPVGYFFEGLEGDGQSDDWTGPVLDIRTRGAVALLRDYSRIQTASGRDSLRKVAAELAGGSDNG